MTTNALLRTYRTVRDAVADIQHTATAVDEHIGRFQIFGTKEDFAQAVSKAASLTEKIQELELQLRRCAPQATDKGAELHGPVHSMAELSPAGIP